MTGLVLDSSILVRAERGKRTVLDVIAEVQAAVGDVPVAVCSITLAELGHGMYRAVTAERASQRREFLDAVKRNIPIHPVTEATAEIIARIGGVQASQGVNLPLADLIIGCSALELGYAVATHNLRDFVRIPGLEVRQL
ncbi:MAG: PIN domain-containing protein [Bryobacteraceae bacterium]